eukprot:gene3826-4216_t
MAAVHLHVFAAALLPGLVAAQCGLGAALGQCASCAGAVCRSCNDGAAVQPDGTCSPAPAACSAVAGTLPGAALAPGQTGCSITTPVGLTCRSIPPCHSYCMSQPKWTSQLDVPLHCTASFRPGSYTLAPAVPYSLGTTTTTLPRWQCAGTSTATGGDAERTCAVAGAWSGKPLQCRQVVCDAMAESATLHTVVRAAYAEECAATTATGTDCMWQCLPGHTAVSGAYAPSPTAGSDTEVRTCGPDGVFSGRRLVCLPVTCDARATTLPTTVPVGDCAGTTPVPPGGRCVWQCAAGHTAAPGFVEDYGTQSGFARICQATGEFTPGPLACTTVTCNATAAPSAGLGVAPAPRSIALCTAVTTPGAVCYFACQPGLVVV